MLLEELLVKNNQPEDSEGAEAKRDKLQMTTVSLHKYVWGLVGIGLLFFATFPIACWRVSNSEKFENRPFKTLTWQESQKNNLAYPEP